MLPLPMIDARDLDAARRSALRPDEVVRDDAGRHTPLPRYFYEVQSWEVARQTELAPCFTLSEFMDVDLHESDALRAYPRYVPCAVALLASALALLRHHTGQPVHIAANGGYRSPAHARSRPSSTHAWGTAANIYRIGDDWLDTQAAIERFSATLSKVCPAAWIRPYGSGAGEADDHLHVDLGCVTFVPRPVGK
jgi:hypothetical protein